MKPAIISKYRKAIPWTDNVERAVRSGALCLQRGQWVQLPWLNRPSRWVGVRPCGTLWMVHHGSTMSRFKTMCQTFQRDKAYEG